MPRKLGPGFHLRRFNPSFEAVGIVADFVSRVPPFEGYGAGALITALKYQILNGCHVAGFDGETLIGYCGWLQITKAEGEEWMQGNGELRPAPPSESDAVALHIVRIDEQSAVLPLIRACRTLEAKKRVFFKRDYVAGGHAAKRSSVLNVGFESS
jgi:hypothetical protein